MRARISRLRATLCKPGASADGARSATNPVLSCPEDWLSRLRSQCCRYVAVGPRHLCKYGCFYREFAPAREALHVRARLAAAGVPPSGLAGWAAELAPATSVQARRSCQPQQASAAGRPPASPSCAATKDWRVVFVNLADGRRLSPAHVVSLLGAAARRPDGTSPACAQIGRSDAGGGTPSCHERRECRAGSSQEGGVGHEEARRVSSTAGCRSRFFPNAGAAAGGRRGSGWGGAYEGSGTRKAALAR